MSDDFKRHSKERKWDVNDVRQLYRGKKNVYLKKIIRLKINLLSKRKSDNEI